MAPPSSKTLSCSASFWPALLGRVLRSLLLLLPALSPDGPHQLLSLPTLEIDAALCGHAQGRYRQLGARRLLPLLPRPATIVAQRALPAAAGSRVKRC